MTNNIFPKKEKNELILMEAYLSSSALCIGLDTLRKAHWHNEGLLYSAFFQISIGLERLMKLMLILSPEPKYKNKIKKYGHDLTALYNECRNISKTNSLNINFSNNGSLEHEILTFFNNFAQKTRYYNVDEISSSSKNTNPLLDWRELSNKIYIAKVSKRRKNQIEELKFDSEKCDKLINQCPTPLQTRIMNNTLMNEKADEICKRLLKIEFTVPHAICLFIRLCNPIFYTLRDMKIDKQLNNQFNLCEFFLFLGFEHENLIRRINFNFHLRN